ncbi:DUF3566 domain-containing protein [Aeromicrobium sp. CF4.19]|uniref:DUF3566 domain-containing protein n=1 Tax=Aeromicrobium sp. CF4.19 TaxID=3373082 RepID=UPI003EE57BD0
MSSTDPQKAPGSGAGDPASTQKIPRTNQQGKQGGKDEAAAKTSAKPSSRPSSSGAAPASRPTTAKPSGAKPPPKDASAEESSTKPPAKDAPTKDSSGKKTPGAAQAPGAAATGSAAAASSASKSPTSAGKGATPSGKSSTTPGKKTTPGGTAKKSSPSASPSATSRGKSGSQPSEAPMTARDYARTTRESAETTSVIPAVRESGGPSGASTAAPSAVDEAASGRRARLRLVHVEPWSVTRLAFVVSVALMIVAVVGVVIFWVVLDLAGVWDSLNGSIVNVLSDGEGTFDLTDYLGLGRLVGLTLLLSAINVIVMTMMATIAAHLYNLSAQLLGGISLTFSDK